MATPKQKATAIKVAIGAVIAALVALGWLSPEIAAFISALL